MVLEKMYASGILNIITLIIVRASDGRAWPEPKKAPEITMLTPMKKYERGTILRKLDPYETTRGSLLNSMIICFEKIMKNNPSIAMQAVARSPAL